MYKNIVIFCSLIALLTACRKENKPAALPNGSISFQYAAGKDTLQMPVSILSDTTLVMTLKAALSGGASSSDHWVNFAVDTTKIALFRAKYGAAVVLPSSSYFFYKPMTRLPAGASVSDPAQLNIVLETKLTEYTTYVLPVVIQSVDGNTEGPATSRVVYFVFKTGKPLFINKIGWTIAGYSSVFNTFVATNVLDDNNTTTYWTSNITQQMPQWIAINFNRTVTFSALNYYVPTALKYPTLGGYPTSIQIETSMDGTTWVSKGVFAGNIVNNMQTLNTGLVTARYVRFTSLTSVKYSSTYSAIFISGISLVP
ncbi:discoidin domain-containing protein [Mucilaginibacter sp. UR6-11]|uniref:discoidin domain-containing protein n=1 Tax=Mucilaginibacter sp. UR6-11 TaxID=1435644 RepID=UPI001E539469|nr:discoidin domain-containing protein [Mucilaginibacter sp. UR6-11]MCC8426879.1 discoidin domain-containing protein [Mucilaginibacter sp. UR6-11]